MAKVLRLALHDIIGRDTEEDVMYMLSKIKEGLFFEFNIWMWYSDKRISDDDILKFKRTYAVDLIRLDIDVRCLNGYEEAVWYDVINNADAPLLRRFKFRLLYDSYLKLPNCLLEFNNFAKSYNNRNIFRNGSKNSNNGVAKVG